MRKNLSNKTGWFFVSLLLLITFGISAAELPVKDPEKAGYKKVPYYGINNLISIEQIHSAIKNGGKNGLILDLPGITTLQDGSTIKPKSIYGKIYIGPYPFEKKEVEYTYKRFGRVSHIESGKGILEIGYLLKERYNSEDWLDRGTVVARLELYLEQEGKDRFLGIYDTFVSFKKEGDSFIKTPSIIEGPLVHMIRSEDPASIAISLKTSEPVLAEVILSQHPTKNNTHPYGWCRYPSKKGNTGKSFRALSKDHSAIPSPGGVPEGRGGLKHEIKITGLEAGKRYSYFIKFGDNESKTYSFNTAPKPGEGSVTFAYAGDSREGIGGGNSNFMGINIMTLERIINLSYKLGADLFIFGGDMISGYTSSITDFRSQFYAWKQTFSSFWHERPVYSCIGNHEAIINVYKNSTTLASLDRWPYDTDSTEAVFADELVHPLNGPEVSNPSRPTYKENVFSFQYGLIKFIVFNNNYWISWHGGTKRGPNQFGGSPEGYIMDDQLDWIKKEIKTAEEDPTVKYVILSGQEPLFPNGGHIQDSMWYLGNNDIRAYTYDNQSGKLEPEKKGIIEIRNELALAVSKCKKIAAVLGSDEHSYHKILIDKDVPVGRPEERENFSTLNDLKYPTWYLTSGGAGAPYYSEEKTPWNSYWKANRGKYPGSISMRGCYYYSSQENVFIFKADSKKISVTVYNPYGEVIDRIENLLKVKGFQ